MANNNINPEILKDRIHKIEELSDFLKKDVIKVIEDIDEKTFNSWKGEEADMFRTKEEAIVCLIEDDYVKITAFVEQIKDVLSKSERNIK